MKNAVLSIIMLTALSGYTFAADEAVAPAQDSDAVFVADGAVFAADGTVLGYKSLKQLWIDDYAPGLIVTRNPAQPNHFGIIDISRVSPLAKGLAIRGGQPTPATYHLLKDVFGVQTILNLRHMTAPNQKLCDELGIKCLRSTIWALDTNIVPSFKVGDTPIGGIVLHTDPEFLQAFRYSIEELEAGKKLYIHCQGGTDRTGVVAAALTIRSYACGQDFDAEVLRKKVFDELDMFGFWGSCTKEAKTKLCIFPVWGDEVRDWVNNFNSYDGFVGHDSWLCK